MKTIRQERNIALLATMLLLAALYTGWLFIQGSLTGTARWDGVIGVLFGLYMASHPAGNALDMLLFMASDAREEILTTGVGRIWLTLNALVMLAAWFVIFIGLTLFVRKTV